MNEINSENINELATALCKFQGEMETVGFDANNPFFKSKYATLAQLVDCSRKLLNKHGIAVSQLIEDDGAVTTILMHTSGQYLKAKVKIEPSKKDPQGIGSAITYSRRYAYAAILGLVSDDDDDGNAATFSKENKPKEKVMPIDIEPVTLKDRVIGTAMPKFGGDMDKFKAWRIDNNLAENLDKASILDLNFILAVLREYVPKQK